MLAVAAGCALAFAGPAVTRVPASRSSAPKAVLDSLPFEAPPLSLPLNLIAEIIGEDGERVYGAVDAPDWIPIVGGIAVIGTALLPM